MFANFMKNILNKKLLGHISTVIRRDGVKITQKAKAQAQASLKESRFAFESKQDTLCFQSKGNIKGG